MKALFTPRKKKASASASSSTGSVGGSTRDEGSSSVGSAPTTPPRNIISTTATSPAAAAPASAQTTASTATTTPTAPNLMDDETVLRSGNSTKPATSKKTKKQKSLEEQLEKAKADVAKEKAGKRKLFHSLVKLANELRKTRETVKQSEGSAWYEGGMWRAPTVLPGIQQIRSVRYNRPQDQDEQQQQQQRSSMASQQPQLLPRQAISLSDLFFALVIVTAFTRVGVAVSQTGYLDTASLLYFAVFWNVWSKEAGYSTRFDTTDLSAQMETLVTCFAVLFACLSVQAPLDSPDGTRIMIMAAFVAVLHCLLHIRVAVTNSRLMNRPAAAAASTTDSSSSPLGRHVVHYAIFNIVMTSLEATVWLVGVFAFPVDWEYRWCIFLGGIVLGLRVPRAFLANDFHAACSQRGVLFILLLGFLLQQIVVVASEFFEYQTPTYEDYAFIGAACLMFFCIKLLYVEDASTLAQDHALLVNRYAAFFFNVGQFTLLLSTTVMGSGLNLLTHDYLAAQAALPGPAKTLVCGGYSAVLLSTFFIKSLHLKRVPTDPRNRSLFIGAYVIQAVVLLAVAGTTAAMCFGLISKSGFLAYLMQTDIQLLFCLSGAALFVVIMSWLDEGVELTLYESVADSREYRVSPFGLWWCLHPEVSDEDLQEGMDSSSVADMSATSRLSVLSPLLGSSLADLKKIRDEDYQSIPTIEERPSSSGNFGQFV